MKYLIRSYNFYFSVVFFIVLFFSSVFIINYFPTENEYYYNGDEGTYYNQAKKVNELGLAGFQSNADAFLKDPYLSLYPPPIRVAHVLFASLILKVNNSIVSLSLLSFIFYAIHCIVCFFFVKKYWGIEAALAAGLLICFSPLSCGMAGRALTEPGYYLFVTLSLFTFIDYLHNQDFKKVFLFVLFFCLSILIKESAVFILPFFGGVLLIQKYIYKKNISFSNIVVLMITPVLLAVCVYFFVFGGAEKVINVFTVINQVNIAAPHLYIKLYNSGPWYQYFVDYFILSPFTSLLFLFFIGYYFSIQKNRSSQIGILLLFFVYFFIVYSFLPKNVRYAQPLDLIYRIGAGLMVLQLFRTLNFALPLKKVILISCFCLMLMSDVMSFRKFFLINKIYDPIAFSLLEVEKFFVINQ